MFEEMEVLLPTFDHYILYNVSNYHPRKTSYHLLITI